VYGGLGVNKVLASVEEYAAGETWQTLETPLYTGDYLFASVPLNVYAEHTTSTQSNTKPKSATRQISETLVVAVLICCVFVVHILHV
jgi:hypothetical protein